MTPTGGSWITKPAYQVLAGVLVIVFILAAYLSSLQQVQEERDQRQKDFEVETIHRTEDIEEGQVKIACSFLRGLEKAFRPASLDGVTDPVTIQRINDANAQRAAAILIIRGQMPPEISNHISKQCPPENG